ncbi:hypothetical protein [Clostridium scatologenes]|uniref:Uncharacterized protein n=1 Tax=Clostridium scatologenes TaxID=1548 RepID=A0A0E3GSF4_CLOSL|nr:hypothetical protein [Clostridium scatologenes]AKA71976.1 hypothetical protein CSCA_4851 [Clostridium scatologenes]
MTYIITIVLKLVISLVIVILSPFAYKTLSALERKSIALAGESNYNFLRIFITDLIKSRPNEFYEEELIKILDTIDNRFGNKFTENEIRILVDSAIKDFGKTVINSVPKNETTNETEVAAKTETDVIEKLQETLDMLKNHNK